MVVARIVGDQHGTGDADGAVGVLLEGRIPEILRKMLLAGGKTDVVRPGVAREGEREADLDWRAVGPPALTLEAQRVGDPDSAGAKRDRVGDRVTALEDEHGQPFPLGEEAAVEGAEQRREAVGAEPLGLRHRQQLDEEAR